jgi:hypothetical protein
MSTLIRFFVELCLLRRGPQDLPGSSALLGLVLAVHLVTAVLVGLAAGLTVPVAVGQGLADALLTLGLLLLALRVTDRQTPVSSSSPPPSLAPAPCWASSP